MGVDFGPSTKYVLAIITWLFTFSNGNAAITQNKANKEVAFNEDTDDKPDDPEMLLTQKYAEGEIDKEEYEEKIAIIKENKPNKENEGRKCSSCGRQLTSKDQDFCKGSISVICGAFGLVLAHTSLYG